MKGATIASLTRPDVPQIADIDWKIREGDFWVVGGFHGAGKTDLLATLAGLQRPLTGNVFWFGDDIWDLKEHQLIEHRLRVGMVFENGGRLFRNLSVAENIALPIRYHRYRNDSELEAEVRTLLELTELSTRTNAVVGTIGQAWQQRVALARALALKPEILILDKPLMGIGHVRWWTDFLSKLSVGCPITASRPITLVMTTDDLPRWLDQGKQFAVLKRNRWHVVGQKAELATRESLLRHLWAEEVTED